MIKLYANKFWHNTCNNMAFQLTNQKELFIQQIARFKVKVPNLFSRDMALKLIGDTIQW